VGGLPLQDLLIQRLRLVVGLGVQLALERGHTAPVLAEGSSTPAELHVEPHERPVHWLLRGVEGDQLESGLNGLIRPHAPARNDHWS
jgi:hypothetical protein